MSASGLTSLSLRACLDGLRRAEFSSVELTRACLEQTERLEPALHAYITPAPEMALGMAAAADRRWAEWRRDFSTPHPALLGVPLAVKDVLALEGLPCTAGSRILEDFRPPYSATTVARLLAAGAVITGKTNTDEFAMGSSTENSAYGPSRNPWDVASVPGGSSGGSAASVAAGEAFLSLGTDTAGSIRQPAAFCGVVGMKPTYGRVSRYGLIAFGSSLDCPGPLARSAEDVALMMNVIAGADINDATAANTPVPDYLQSLNKGIHGMRIGISPDFFKITYPNSEKGDYSQQPLSEEMLKAVMGVAEVYRALGAEIIEDVPMPNTKYGIPAFFVISRVEAASNLHRFDGVKYGYRTNASVKELKDMYRRSRGEAFGLQPKLRILMGMYVSAAQYSQQYYQRALRVRTLIRRDFEQVFDPDGKYRLDALLTPTTPTTAFSIQAVFGDSVMMQYADQLTVTANHAGIPGISFPAGFDKAGLPVGVQLLGADFSEALLLRLVHAYEKATADAEWRKRKPAVLGEA